MIYGLQLQLRVLPGCQFRWCAYQLQSCSLCHLSRMRTSQSATDLRFTIIHAVSGVIMAEAGDLDYL